MRVGVYDFIWGEGAARIACLPLSRPDQPVVTSRNPRADEQPACMGCDTVLKASRAVHERKKIVAAVVFRSTLSRLPTCLPGGEVGQAGGEGMVMVKVAVFPKKMRLAGIMSWDLARNTIERSEPELRPEMPP